MNKSILDLYSDYLISSFSLITATGLSSALGGAVTHDQITRFLSGNKYDSRILWKMVKKTVREIESKDAVLIFDDTIEEKPHSDESELISTHYDHSSGGYVKGINILSCLYHSKGFNIPVAFQTIEKLIGYTGKKKAEGKRKCGTSKNEYFRQILEVCAFQNDLLFEFVLSDIWFSSIKNMKFIKLKVRKEFVMPIKSNRLIAFSKKEKLRGEWQQVSKSEIEAEKEYEIWIKGLTFPVVLIKQVFLNKDGSTGILYLICSKLNQKSQQIIDIYHKRWNIEPQYKSIKYNLGLAKSPTKVCRTQGNHIFSCFYAYFKLEKLRMKTGLNHFALKTRLYLKALQASMSELQFIKERYGLI